jgi:hypothetical protein
MNYLEEKVLRHACTVGRTSFDNFPEHDRQELGDAFQSLKRKGYADVALLPNNSDSPEEFAFGELVRVTQKGRAWFQSLA